MTYICCFVIYIILLTQEQTKEVDLPCGTHVPNLGLEVKTQHEEGQQASPYDGTPGERITFLVDL